jgi:hypothetical protein
MLTNALYNWSPTHAPVNIAFVQEETFSGSGFPEAQWDHAFVSESGPTWATGPQVQGKRIVEFDPDPDNGGEIGGHPRDLVEYTGTGKATAAALTAGPDGLYFTDLYKDLGYSSPIDPGARLLRVRYGPPLTPRLSSTQPTSPADGNSPRVIGSAATIGSTLKLYTDPACTHLAAAGTADQLASSGIQVSVPDNSSTTFHATATVAGATSGCSAPGLTYVEQTLLPPPAGAPGDVAQGGFNLKAAKRRCKKKFPRGAARAKCIKRAKKRARAV